MSFLKAYIFGWQNLFGNLKLWLSLYLINLGFALIASFGLSSYLNSTIGDSLVSAEGLAGFSYTIVGDLLNNYGESFGVILNQSIGILIIYFCISIFTTGGIASVFLQEKRDMGSFWAACGTYFWRMLRLTVYFLILSAGVLGIFFFLYRKFALDMFPFQLEEESILSKYLYILLPIYFFFASLIFTIQDYSKFHIVQNSQWLIAGPIFKSIAFTIRNYIPCIILFLLNFSTFLIVYLAYYFISDYIPTSSFSGILLFFIFSQFFILMRIALKLINLGGVSYLYRMKR